MPAARVFKRIVVGVDGSNPSKDAARYAIDLAKKVGARVHIVTVIDYSTFYTTTSAGVAAWAGVLNSIRDSARSILNATVHEAQKAGVTNSSALLESHDAATGIVKEAEKIEADLLIVGSHGRTGLRRVLIGSVAERVMRLAHCPVLVIR
jgi:nucleotide-binding universal stress UspA family protein